MIVSLVSVAMVPGLAALVGWFAKVPTKKA
ncbi:Flp pilus assembly pilin Flp [Variovorax sp. PvP013]